MQGGSGAHRGLHFAGVNTWLLARHLRDLGDDALARVLHEAGDPRTEAELLDLATWSSYEQFRSLLETTTRLFGANELTRASAGGLAESTPARANRRARSAGNNS